MLNFLFKIASLTKKGWWFIFRPITVGVKVIATYENKILLVKTRYSNYWSLPGGGVKKGESVFDCAKRETLEETGIKIDRLKCHGIYFNFSEYKSDHIILLSAEAKSDVVHSGLEIEKIKFFDFNSLPENASSATKRRIQEYLSGATSSIEKW